MTPLLGKKVWFAPRPFGGWGWQPVSWEGWVASAVWVAAVVGVTARFQEKALLVAIGAIVVLVVLCSLKGTSPGGPESAERYRTWARGHRRTPEEVERDRRLRHDVPDEPSVTDAAARLRKFRRPGAS